MNNNVHSALDGTQTHKNLTDVFGSEARSAARYRVFANAASENGDHVLARLLHGLADNRTALADVWMGYLGDIGTNAENLESLIASGDYESTVMYPELSQTAKEEGFSEIAEKLALAAEIGTDHIKLLRDYLDSMGEDSAYGDDTKWHCTNCGYTFTGSNVPHRCPLCSYPGSYYSRES